MAYVEKTMSAIVTPEILASEHFKAFTETIPQAMGTDVNGRKIVRMGTVFPANDVTAKGLVLTDIDVTDGDAVGSVMIEGVVYKERLPVAIAGTAILPNIQFR